MCFLSRILRIQLTFSCDVNLKKIFSIFLRIFSISPCFFTELYRIIYAVGQVGRGEADWGSDKTFKDGKRCDMMHYAQVILEAKSLGFDDEQATEFARRVVTTAALMAMRPEDVLRVWNGRSEDKLEDRPVLEAMTELSESVMSKAA